MAFKALVNGVEVKKKNRIVLEIVKKYIERNPNISYEDLKRIFPDELQGSIGVLKNEKELEEWEKGKKETRKDRFFIKLNDVIFLGNDKIYVCTEWGDGNTIHNFKPFIKYSQEKLDFDIKYNSKKFFGLWINRDVDVDEVIKSGVWVNKLSNVDRIPEQMSQINIEDEVFLYQGIEDVEIKDTPFMKYLPNNCKSKESTLVKVKCWATGVVKRKENNSLVIEWNKSYQPNEWYVYFRQDGVWKFEINSSNNLQQKKYQEVYDMAFKNKKQDYKWWLENGNIGNLWECKGENKNMVKNIILYGSPGVGKTHSIKFLIDYIEGKLPFEEIFKRISKNEKNDNDLFGAYDNAVFENRVKFVTFHQSFGYEDFIEGFRPNKDGTIELANGIFKEICQVNKINLFPIYSSIGQFKSECLNDSYYAFVNVQKIVDELNEKIDKNSKVKELQIRKNSFFIMLENKISIEVTDNELYNSILDKIFDESEIIDLVRLKVDTSYGHYADIISRYFFEWIKKINNFKDLKTSCKNVIESEIRKSKKNKYLVIDEINRGNISKIFGELITLIEEDKRDVLEVTLPYSKKPFRVPSNLYIIGTMNSTDKSIALIDIALRRRFTFLKMEPNADLIEYNEARVIFDELNKRIEKDLGKDYQLGHSYFMNIQNSDDLDFVLEYKIIPLLEEYYYGDDRLNDISAICKI